MKWNGVQAAAETVPATETALQVFVDMWRDRKSCMGIVAENNELVGNLSISDLRLLDSSNFALLAEPVSKFILAARGYAVPEVRFSMLRESLCGCLSFSVVHAQSEYFAVPCVCLVGCCCVAFIARRSR
jgi:hypothetical protein